MLRGTAQGKRRENVVSKSIETASPSFQTPPDPFPRWGCLWVRSAGSLGHRGLEQPWDSHGRQKSFFGTAFQNAMITGDSFWVTTSSAMPFFLSNSSICPFLKTKVILTGEINWVADLSINCFIYKKAGLHRVLVILNTCRMHEHILLSITCTMESLLSLFCACGD